MPAISGPDEDADHNISLCLLQGATLSLERTYSTAMLNNLIVILTEVKG